MGELVFRDSSFPHKISSSFNKRKRPKVQSCRPYMVELELDLLLYNDLALLWMVLAYFFIFCFIVTLFSFANQF